nr:hypothetical protein [Tanacetum cinerariifolium]
NINPVSAKQVAFDNALVPPEKRLKIEKCNARIEFNKPQREETYQVTLDALKLFPCYPAFLITTKVPKVYMHKFWNTIQKINDPDAYRFKLDKKKNLVILASVICYPLSILIKCTGLGEHLLLSSIEEPTVKPKRAKRPAKKSTIVQTTGVVIRNTPNESVPKKKTLAKVDRGKGMDLLLNIALLEAAQLKKSFKKSKLETHKLHASGLDNPKVHDEQEEKKTDTDEGTGDKEGSDSEKTDSDEDENPNLNQNDDEEELKEIDHEEEGKRDEEMTDVLSCRVNYLIIKF